jgi:prolyl-tRNA synthetase
MAMTKFARPPKLGRIRWSLSNLLQDENKSCAPKTEVFVAQLRTEIRVKVDDRDNYKPWWKFNEWEMKGVLTDRTRPPRVVAENQS